MQSYPTHPAHQDDLTIPAHLAPYAAEVEAWRLEALAYRAARIETGTFR
jgi:hypothetical protein